MNVIEVNNLVKKYNNHLAVDGISFSVKEGELFSFLGENGAGKSTLIRVLSGVYARDAGTVKVNGENIPCTPKEVEILHLLASHAGQAFLLDSDKCRCAWNGEITIQNPNSKTSVEE